ncbi:MAG TPA: LLM class flavin-dependent oxidoreductase [Gemmatimonadales bacterium]|nr:LLM class flavin-dependent oxidoreductase [Gemmatimonadales bacterium]
MFTESLSQARGGEVSGAGFPGARSVRGRVSPPSEAAARHPRCDEYDSAGLTARTRVEIRESTSCKIERETPSGASMRHVLSGAGLQVFATCPPSYTAEPRHYLRQVLDVAAWSEAAGCEGILIYTDNGLVDPWTVAHAIVAGTQRLTPLVAVQPVYMHPYTVAKIVTSLAFFYGRRTYLNMVTGGFKNDFTALNDQTPHDERYARIIEYTAIIQDLLKGEPVTRSGRHYAVTNLKLAPPLPPELAPGVMISGSSPAGLDAARQLGALAVQYPKPADQQEPPPEGVTALGIRVGIVTRETSAEAWAVARARFPEDRKGQLTHQLAMKVSDSQWHQQLSELGQVPPEDQSPYWMVPFENYKTFCPYLVGSYDRVADELARYVALGYRTVILDVPASPVELEHTGHAFFRATERVPA